MAYRNKLKAADAFRAGEHEIATGAACWASYLIDGDASDLSAEEKVNADAWAEKQLPWYVVSEVEGSERFTWDYKLHCGGSFSGGSVVDYVLYREE